MAGRPHPKTLLFVLIGLVPLVVAVAGVASFLLLRAGHGLLVWAGLPFLATLLVAGLLGAVLGRAARGRGPDGGHRQDRGDRV